MRSTSEHVTRFQCNVAVSSSIRATSGVLTSVTLKHTLNIKLTPHRWSFSGLNLFGSCLLTEAQISGESVFYLVHLFPLKTVVGTSSCSFIFNVQKQLDMRHFCSLSVSSVQSFPAEKRRPASCFRSVFMSDVMTQSHPAVIFTHRVVGVKVQPLFTIIRSIITSTEEILGPPQSVCCPSSSPHFDKMAPN